MSSDKKTTKQKDSLKKGFTLLEVVIALAVFGFLIGGVLKVLVRLESKVLLTAWWMLCK